MTPANLEKGTAVLKRPAAIAIIASLGLHGLLGISLPVWSGGNKDQEAKKAVKLVDLTPAEQSRLPQTQTAGITLPPLQSPLSPTLGVFGKSLFQPLPDSTFTLSAPTANSPSPATKGTGIISPDLYLNQPLPNLTIKYPESPPATTTPVKPTTPMPPENTTPTAPAPTAPAPTDPTVPPTAPVPNATTPVPGQVTVDPVRAAADQKARMLTGFKLAQQLQVSGGTSLSREDQLTRYNAWKGNILQTGKATPEELEQNVIPRPVSLPCPAGDCADKLVAFTVVVDRDGQLLGDPGLIVKTGDAALDKAAEQEFHKLLPDLQKPPEKNQVTVYLIQVDFTGQKAG